MNGVPVPETMRVPVKSAWFSKINWTAATMAAFSLLAAFGLDISEHTRSTILTLEGTLGPLLIMVFRTFFNASVTPSSAPSD